MTGSPSGPLAGDPNDSGLFLVREDDRASGVALLAERLGGRVGLAGVLEDLDRTAREGPVPALAADWGFRLDPRDDDSDRWWPQGITCSGDAPLDRRGGDTAHGRRVVLTSAYAKQVDGVGWGSRITVVDVSDPGRVRYRHVLLVEAVAGPDGLRLEPVPVHAGGLVWHGGTLQVAATAQGLCSFDLDDVVAVPATGSPDRLGTGPRGVDAFGHRYVLPLRCRWRGHHREGIPPLRHSFVSLDRSGPTNRLVVGEYGRGRATTRIAYFDLDPRTGLPAPQRDGRVPATEVHDGVAGMQGDVVVEGRHHVSTSAGKYRRGSLWTGAPGSLRRHPGVLAVGCEDLVWWPGEDRIWSVSEHPGHRWVWAMRRSAFDP